MTRYGRIVLYKEWLCTECGESYPHKRSLPKSGKPTNCETCFYRANPSGHEESKPSKGSR